MKVQTALKRIEKVVQKKGYAYHALYKNLKRTIISMPTAHYSGNGRFTRLLDYTNDFEEILKAAKIKYRLDKPSHLTSPIHYTLILTNITF